MLNRREFIAISGGVVLAAARPAIARTAIPPAVAQERLRAIEAQVTGRLGVHLLDTATGREVSRRPDEKFMLLSSFKLLASALVLHRVDGGRESLNRRIHYRASDLVAWSPVTERHVDKGMTLAELCEATVTTSDNTAANLILTSFGGPGALTAYLRGLGDQVTRLDRFEPELNVAHPEAPFDTTSPRAMVTTMKKLLLGNALTPQSRGMLVDWLVANTTGDARLRAGVPACWRVGDKTGTNATASNDVAVIWPPGRAPLLVAAYLADSTADAAARDSALAAVGRLLPLMTG